jgi:hypothetical protein
MSTSVNSSVPPNIGTMKPGQTGSEISSVEKITRNPSEVGFINRERWKGEKKVKCLFIYEKCQVIGDEKVFFSKFVRS